MQEIWKDIPNYEGYYTINNCGVIKSIKRNKIVKPYIDKDGYYRVQLYKNTKKICIGVHKCVAEAFIPNPNGYNQINHKDENKTNNYVDNLEWCDNWYNIHYGSGIKRSKEKRKRRKVAMIKNNQVIKIFNSIVEASLDTNIALPNIIKVCKKQRKSAGGYSWEYID